MTKSTTANLPTTRSSDSMPSSMRPVLARLQWKAATARRRWHECAVQACSILEPETPFIDGMHVRAVFDPLQAVTEGKIRNLIVNVPPGHAKSLLTAVF